MRTINFRTFFEGELLPYLNLGAEDHAAGTSAGERFVTYLNDGLRHAYQAAFWPEITKVEQRTLDADGVLNFSEDGKTDIDAVESIHATEAAAIQGASRLPFCETPGGFTISGVGAGATPFVRLRPYPPRLTRMDWKPEATYYANDTAYSAVTGTCYRSLKEQAGNDPDGDDGTNWEAVEIPLMFTGYLKVFAAMQNAEFERKYDEAGRRDSAAKDELFRLKKARGL